MLPKKIAYSVEEAMEALNLSRKGIYIEINSGRLKSYKIGRRRHLEERDLVAWQDAMRTGKCMR